MIRTVKPMDTKIHNFLTKAVLSEAEKYSAENKKVSEIMVPAGISEDNFRMYLMHDPIADIDHIDIDKVYRMVELASCELTTSAEEMFGYRQARTFIATKFVQLIKSVAVPFFVNLDTMEEVILYAMAVAQDASEKFVFSEKLALYALLKEIYLTTTPESEQEEYTEGTKENITSQFKNLRSLVTVNQIYDFWSDFLPTDACKKIMIYGIRNGLIEINKEYPGYGKERLAEGFVSAGTNLPDDLIAQLINTSQAESPFTDDT